MKRNQVAIIMVIVVLLSMLSSCRKVQEDSDFDMIKNYVDYSIDQITTSPLHGKKVIFTGDSICQGTTDESKGGGWAGRIGKKHSMDWINAGKSGGTMTNMIVVDSPFCIADTDFGKDPDYIIIEGGVNDANKIGIATGNIKPKAFGKYNYNDYDGFDTATFCGAIESLFKRVTTDYPEAKIGFIIPYKIGSVYGNNNYSTSNIRYYFETIITLCEKWGIPYIDLWKECHLNPMNPVHLSGEDPFYANEDALHITAKGYDYVTPIIEKWMETL